jgi:hypothetical protein
MTKVNDKGSPLTNHQLSQLLAGLLSSKEILMCKKFDEIADYILTQCGNIKTPFGISEFFKVEERLPILTFSIHKREKSKLILLLKDRFEEVAIVADAVLPAKESLYFATLTGDKNKLFEWLGCMNPNSLEMYCLKVGEDYLILTPVGSFIH